MSRDCDEQGRPLNSRHRDALGRPLPRGEVGVPPLTAADLTLGPDATLDRAQGLLDDERPFQAHEVLEAMWKRAVPGERALWQALAQVAVAVTHVGRGNRFGARTLLARAGAGLAGFRGSTPYGIDAVALIEWTAAAVATLDDQDPTGLPPWGLPPVRLRIRDESSGGTVVVKTSLDALAREQLEAAHRTPAARASSTVVGGHERALRQTVIALTAGTELAEHDNPGEASLYVLTGRVELHSGGDTWEARTGDLLDIPSARHSVRAVEDSAVLPTSVPSRA